MRIAALRMVGLASLTALMLTLLSLPGYASDSFKIGAVAPQAIFEKSKAGKLALDGLKEYVSAKQKLLAKDDIELRNYEKQIKDQLPKLSETEKKEKEAQLQAKMQDFQKRAQDFNMEIQKKQKDLIDEYMKKISAATKTVAEKGGFSLIVEKGSEPSPEGKAVIYSSNKDAIDLTEQVIKEFDSSNK
jgi:outer membrane protein